MNSNKEAELIIEEALSKGTYPVANLELLKIIKNITLSEKTLRQLSITKELLTEQLDSISSLGSKANSYLDSIKEKCAYFPNKKIQDKNKEEAINRLISLIQNKQPITSKDIKEIHELLLDGEVSEDNKYLRNNNSIYVGTPLEEGRRIDYIPIDYHQIEEALNLITDIYNTYIYSSNKNDIFIIPIIIHGLFASLQMFHDGNTRIGRLLQSVLMWHLINENTEYNFDSPAIYSNPSTAYRGEYRKLIVDLVTKNDNEAWNNWIVFNLRRIEDQIFENDIQIENINITRR